MRSYFGPDFCQERSSQALQFVNWDTTRNRMVHYEASCGACRTRAEAVDHVYDAIVNSLIAPASNC
eukprot:8966667-Pyramimonas_sp.AAC.1